MTIATSLSIDEYLRKRLMPVEGAIPQIAGIEMYGNSLPAETVGGDLFEYINFQQRYNIDARIANAHRLAEDYLRPLLPDAAPRNEVDAHVRWLQSRSGHVAPDCAHYRQAKSGEQLRIAENLQELNTTAGVLLVDAQGHGVIAAKIASTVHDTFHAFMLCELDQKGKPTVELCEKLNLRLAQSVTARNALGRGGAEGPRELATMLYGEVRPHGEFRFVSFGHPPPLVFSVKYEKFMEIHAAKLMRFLPLGLEIPEDHPDRSRYVSMSGRQRRMKPSDVAEINLMGEDDVLFLYTDGVYDGSDLEARKKIEAVMLQHKHAPAKEICNAILDYALDQDRHWRENGEPDRIDDKTVIIIKRT